MAKQDDPDMSNLAAFPHQATIKEEAGRWIVRMDQRALRESERRELRRWILQSDFHREYLLKLAANWDSMAVLESLAELFPLPEKEPRDPDPGGRRSRLKAWLRERFRLPVPVLTTPVLTTIGASFIAILTLLVGLILNGRGERELATAVGELASYTLSDGTLVSLNTNTRISVDYTEARRALTLIRGEASFAVARNPERPFVVYAGGGLVWAVGTAFNVRNMGETIDVFVTEGLVKVFSDTRGVAEAPKLDASSPSAKGSGAPAPRSEALIGAGQSLRYAQVIESLESIREDELARKLAWQQRSLIFKGETLQEAIAEIGRYTNKEIIITDPSLGALRVGGHYKTDDIHSLLASLGQALDIDIRYDSDNRVLLAVKQYAIQ